MSASELLTEDAIRPFLTTQTLGGRIFAYDRAGSTNDLALETASRSSESPDGTLIVAEYQTRGRGRFGRVWTAPPRVNLLFSLVLFPQERIARPSLLTLAMGVAVAEGIQRVTELAARLKWPNDVSLSGKKVCGILTESGTRRERMPFWVIGVGVNANMRRGDFPPELADRATTLYEEWGGEVNRAALLGAILGAFERWYGLLKRNESQTLLAAVKRRTETLGSPIRARLGELQIEGIAFDLDEDGALLVRTALGKHYRLTATEGTLLG